MKKEFWIQKWHTGDIAFHQSSYHSELEKYGSRFLKGTVLVPLCGKSLDMQYLASLGHQVIGVELSSKACMNFFEESEIGCAQKNQGSFTVYESEKIALWCGDFFELPDSVWSQVTGIYDRAAMVALPEELRARYVQLVKEKSSQKIEILCVTMEYEPGTIEGPPFSISETDLRGDYSAFNVELLSREAKERPRKDPSGATSIKFFEATYWISRV